MARIDDQQKQQLEKKRRDQIVEAAVACWVEAGYDATTVASIARQAGVAKGTVYLYFETKEDILAESIRRYSLTPSIRGALEGMTSSPSATTVRRLVTLLWHAMKARAAVMQFLVREVCARPEHGREFFEMVVLPSNELLAEHFEKRASAGDMRPLNWFVAARALVGMLTIFVFTQEVFGGKDIKPLTDDEIIDTVSQLFLHGAVATAEASSDAA